MVWNNELLMTNIEKGEMLENAIYTALTQLNINPSDLTQIYNFHSPYNKCVPDFICSNVVIESKNWNCEKYYVTKSKAYTEIYKRFKNPLFWKLKKILIISNPKWIKKVKLWVKSLGIEIFELGYFVTIETYDRAINDLIKFFKKLFGYAYTNTNINTSIFSSIDIIDTIKELLFKLDNILDTAKKKLSKNLKSSIVSLVDIRRMDINQYRRLKILKSSFIYFPFVRDFFILLQTPILDEIHKEIYFIGSIYNEQI